MSRVVTAVCFVCGAPKSAVFLGLASVFYDSNSVPSMDLFVLLEATGVISRSPHTICTSPCSLQHSAHHVHRLHSNLVLPHSNISQRPPLHAVHVVSEKAALRYSVRRQQVEAHASHVLQRIQIDLIARKQSRGLRQTHLSLQCPHEDVIRSK